MIQNSLHTSLAGRFDIQIIEISAYFHFVKNENSVIFATH